MPAQTRHPIDTLFEPATLLSVFAAGELLALILTLAPEIEGARLVRFGLLSFSIQWICLFSLASIYVLRHSLRSWPASMLVGLVIALLFLMTVLSAWVCQWLLPTSNTRYVYSWFATSLRLFGSMLCMLLFGLVALRSHWSAQTLEYRAKQAELDALRARANPHFLFNTLNTATALLHDQPDQAERVLLDLSDLFRAALSENEISTLQQEIELTRRYLEIEALRLSTRLDVAWQLPQPLPNINMPTLALQALVENAVHHGIEANPGPTQLLIHAEETATEVILRVENTLPEAPSTLHRGHRVGLAASRARIDAMTHGEGSLRTHEEGGRFIAEIRLPRQAAAPRD